MAEKIFFRSTALSILGDNFTSIAIATLLYNLTGDAKAVASLFIFQFFAIFVSGVLVPYTIDYVQSKKNLLVLIDIARGVIISSLIFFQHPWYIYFIVFIDALLNGYYHPTKQSGIQGLIPSEKRVSYISSIQSAANVIQISIPAFAGFLMSYIRIEIFFVIDALTFIVAGVVLLKLNDWTEKKEVHDHNFFKKIYKSYHIIFSHARYYQPLIFRFLLLFALSAFSVIKMITLTEFSNNISIYNLPDFVTFSFALGAISSVGSVGAILVSVFVKSRYKASNLKPAFLNGIVLLCLGFLFWAVPVGYHFSWIGYLLGTFILFSGLTFARIGLHTAGFELTEKAIFVEIASSSDALARLWQAFISYSIVGLFGMVPLGGLVGFGSFLISMAIFPANKIDSLVKKKFVNKSNEKASEG